MCHLRANWGVWAALGVPMPNRYALSGSICAAQMVNLWSESMHRAKKDRHAFRPVKMHTKRTSSHSEITQIRSKIALEFSCEMLCEKVTQQIHPDASQRHLGIDLGGFGASWEWFGRLRETSGYVLESSQIVLLRPKASQRPPRVTLD